MADDDVALGEEILNVANAEVEAKQPDGVGDHLGREPVATVGRRQAGGATGHRASLLAAQLDNSTPQPPTARSKHTSRDLSRAKTYHTR